VCVCVCVCMCVCSETLLVATQCASGWKIRIRGGASDYNVQYCSNTLWLTCWCCRQLKKSVSSWQFLCTDRDPEFWSKQDSWQPSDLATSQHFLAASSHFISVSEDTIIKRSLVTNMIWFIYLFNYLCTRQTVSRPRLIRIPIPYSIILLQSYFTMSNNKQFYIKNWSKFSAKCSLK